MRDPQGASRRRGLRIGPSIFCAFFKSRLCSFFMLFLRAHYGILLRRGVTGELAQTRKLLKASAPRKYTVDGCREAIQNAKPLFGLSIRPLLRLESVLALFAVLFACCWIWVM